jgi:hypothetical protein
VGAAAALEFKYGAGLPGRIVGYEPGSVPLGSAADKSVMGGKKPDDGCGEPVPVGKP